MQLRLSYGILRAFLVGDTEFVALLRRYGVVLAVALGEAAEGPLGGFADPVFLRISGDRGLSRAA
jgi:hypothetical protein